MKKRQERADKGQPRKPQAQKRKHNWQVLLNDDEDVVIENYLKKEGIDKAFFMRRAMLRAVPKAYRTLDLRTTNPGTPENAPKTLPEVPETRETPLNHQILVPNRENTPESLKTFIADATEAKEAKPKILKRIDWNRIEGRNKS